MPAGRPSKYDPKFCDVVIAVGEEGGWLCEMAEACDVHRSTMDNWASEHPEFFEALARAKQKAQAWFEKTGRQGLMFQGFNASLWSKQMSARHPSEYTERREHGHSGSIEVTTKEQRDAAVAAALRAES